jgi:hypothetical protein
MKIKIDPYPLAFSPKMLSREDDLVWTPRPYGWVPRLSGVGWPEEPKLGQCGTEEVLHDNEK